MKTGRKKHLTIITLCIFAALYRDSYSFAAETALSDPDHISTGFEYSGISQVKLGDSIGYGNFLSGGMADIRNESRFNEEAIPNHCWRGFLFLYYSSPMDYDKTIFKFTSGFEHESAHPTGGLIDRSGKAYDRIYDGAYRNINMNSFMMRISRRSGTGYEITYSGDMQFYFHSRNTPELPVNELTSSEGISGSVEFRYPVSENTVFFISAFDRYILQGRKKISADIYCDTDSGVVTQFRKYPVINNINTFSLKGGMVLGNIIPERKISLYCGFLYGNISGFTDSRENRTVYSLGVEILH